MHPLEIPPLQSLGGGRYLQYPSVPSKPTHPKVLALNFAATVIPTTHQLAYLKPPRNGHTAPALLLAQFHCTRASAFRHCCNSAPPPSICLAFTLCDNCKANECSCTGYEGLVSWVAVSSDSCRSGYGHMGYSHPHLAPSRFAHF